MTWRSGKEDGSYYRVRAWGLGRGMEECILAVAPT